MVERRGPTDNEREADRFPLHVRIRNLRHKLGVTGYELAERAGISPSYVSLIEKGLKVPNEDVAIRIARVLGDDENLYRAWARSARHGDLPGARRAVETASRASTDPRFRERIARGDRVELAEDRVLGLESREERKSGLARLFRGSLVRGYNADSAESDGLEGPGSLLEIPILPRGVDPGPPDYRPFSRAEGFLRLDARMLELQDRESALALRAGDLDLTRVAHLVEPSSIVVISRRFREPSAERIHAVRLEGVLTLSRALLRGDLLLLLPPPDRSDIRELEFKDREDLLRILVGPVVLMLRRWD